MILKFQQQIIDSTQQYLAINYGTKIEQQQILVQKTKPEFEGDFTLVCFPFVSLLKKTPDAIANEIGAFLINNINEIENFNIIKGFLNIKLKQIFWFNFLKENITNQNFGFVKKKTNKILIEYSSPNTNKPLHLGHIRNNLLGFSVSKILEAAGNEVIKVNLVNDRGIHICKSMLAWTKWGNGETPETSGLKGDHLIGKYYVIFDIEYKKQIQNLIDNGSTKEIAEKEAPLIIEAQAMLLKWEGGDKEILEIWKKLNGWVLEGFDETYKKLGISFEKTYFESNTYLLGKKLVSVGLDNNTFYKKDNNSIWVDLTQYGFDEKLLLRADGTSVYITQDIGTAFERYEEFRPDKMIYVVGNEQNYHFDILKLILKNKLSCTWANNIYHLSYGMVELPSGKMKSREGTVVDADDLMDVMIEEAKKQTIERGKTDNFSETELSNLFNTIGLGALKYFILKIDPKKSMLFNPEQSIDLSGNTAPFIQYTHSRICSIIKKYEVGKADYENIELKNDTFNNFEIELLKSIYEFPMIISEASKNLSPALLANYIYDLVKLYNVFYQEVQILKELDINKKFVRIEISKFTKQIIKNGMSLLGIEVPERM